MDFAKAAKAALEKRSGLVAELRAVNDDATLSAAEKQVTQERITVDIQSLESEARSHVEAGEREAEVRSLVARAGAIGVPFEAKDEKRKGRDLDAELRSALLGESRSFEIAEAMLAEKRATGVTTSSTYAGTTVEAGFVAEVIDSLREHSPILSAGAKMIMTSKGNRIDYPVKNGRLLGNRIVAENVNQTFGSMSFSRISLDAFKYTVGAEITEELLRDSELSLASLVASDIGEELAFLTTRDFINGTGTAEPEGLLTSTTLGLTSATIPTTFTFDNVIKLQHSVVPRYRQNGQFYTSDSAVLALRLIKDNDGRYIYQDQNVAGTVGGTLMGAQVWVDVEMPAATAAAKPVMVYGDFSKGFAVRMVGGVDVQRSDEYGWERDTVAWKGRVYVDSFRTDGAALAYLKNP